MGSHYRVGAQRDEESDRPLSSGYYHNSNLCYPATGRYAVCGRGECS